MYQVVKTIMKCSKCNSMNIVAPCNEDDVQFRCTDCDHEKKTPTPEACAMGSNEWTHTSTGGDYEILI